MRAVFHRRGTARHRAAAALVDAAARRAGEFERRFRGCWPHPVRERRRFERLRYPARAAGARDGHSREAPGRASHRRNGRARRPAAAVLRRPRVAAAFHRIHHGGNARGGPVRNRRPRLAARQPGSRERRGHAPAGGRPRQSRAALAVHRAAPAREHPGGRHPRAHSPHQRIGCADAGRQQGLSRRPPRRSLAAAALSAGELAAEYRRHRHLSCGRADFRRRRRGAGHPRAFRAARHLDARGRAGISRGHQSDHGESAAVEARGARPAERQHRARDQESRRRNEPRGPAPRGIAATSSRRSAASRRSSATTPTG